MDFNSLLGGQGSGGGGGGAPPVSSSATAGLSFGSVNFGPGPGSPETWIIAGVAALLLVVVLVISLK